MNKRTINALLRTKRNTAHKDRKRASKSVRTSNAALWRVLNTGV